MEFLETKADFVIKALTRDEKTGEEFYPFEGYASTYDIDYGEDRVKSGAFFDTIAEKGPRFIDEYLRSDIKVLYQHDWSRPIGLPEVMREDSRGLLTKGRIYTGLSDGKDVALAIKTKIIDKMSIGYKPKAGAVDYSEEEHNGKMIRIRNLHKVDLFEYSPVTFPMNQWADITKQMGFGKKIYHVGLNISPNTLAQISKECNIPVGQLQDIYLRTPDENIEKEIEVVTTPDNEAKGDIDAQLLAAIKSIDPAMKSLLLKLLGSDVSETTPTPDPTPAAEKSAATPQIETKNVEDGKSAFSLEFSSWVKSQLTEAK